MSPWIQVAWLVIQFLLKRYGVMRTHSTAYAASDAEVEAIATALVKAEPQLNFDCVKTALPKLLSDLGDYLDSTGGEIFGNLSALIDLVVGHLSSLVKCQLAASGQKSAMADADLRGKIMGCAVAALQSAAGQFFTCMLGGTGGGGGAGGGGSNPLKPTLNQIKRCGG